MTQAPHTPEPGRATTAASVAIVLGVAAACGAAHAQLTPALRPVNPGTQDVGPLSTSLRLVPLDLRHESDFSRVYALDADRFARQAGGLFAIFPRSVYVATADGFAADIPPGTIFQIGWSPPDPAPGPPSTISRTQRVDLRVPEPTRLSPVGSGVAHAPEPAGTDPAPPGMWEDESARRASIARLLGVTPDARQARARSDATGD